MRTCYETQIAGFPVKIEQSENRHGRFTVTYGEQVKPDLSYVEAAREFGLCVFHALVCDGSLNNEGGIINHGRSYPHSV